MNERTLEKLTAELASVLTGQRFGKIFTLARLQLAIDFRLPDGAYLFISLEPSAPRVYLIKRRLRDLEKSSKNQTAFVMFLRKRLANARLDSIEKLKNERVLRFALITQNDLGAAEKYFFIIQLTGRSANIFLLDKNDFILDACRENIGDGQEIASRYAPPTRPEGERKLIDDKVFSSENFANLSEALDDFYQTQAVEKRFQTLATNARNKLKQERQKREKLIKNLEQDLRTHGSGETWKRFGDLLLANLATAKRSEKTVVVNDYFDEDIPELIIEIDENDSLTEAAERFFKRYTKSRNAQTEVSKRLAEINSQIEILNAQNERLERAVEEKDEAYLTEFSGEKGEIKASKSKEKTSQTFKGARQYFSSEGFEILVGKASKDNDYLTFRIAKASDLWLHAADYPGSHVIVKNPTRGEIPPKTLLEAAQYAAFFSHAREQPKVAVHYTPKKFVNKPKGAAHGLVSLASFKTILVEPKIAEKQI